jgi:hypothetical protein
MAIASGHKSDYYPRSDVSVSCGVPSSWDAHHSGAAARPGGIGRLPYSVKIGQVPMRTLLFGVQAVCSGNLALETVFGRPNAHLMP